MATNGSPAADEATVHEVPLDHRPEKSDLELAEMARKKQLDPESEFAEDIMPHDDVPEDIEKDKVERSHELEDPTVVKWAPDDQMNPHHWSKLRRWYITMLNSTLVLNATLASSAPSGIAIPLTREFGATQLQTTMVISIFVLGYVLGPCVWAPASEVLGRQPVNIVSGFGMLVFNIGCAFAPSIGAMLVLRLFTGICGAASLTNAGGVTSDVWPAQERAMPMVIFSMMPFLGPILGPVISGYMGMERGWRTVFYFLIAFSALCLLGTFSVPETYHPVLLTKKAKQIRAKTGKTIEECASPTEKSGRTVSHLLMLSLTRPMVFLFTELIVALTSIYAAFIYGVLYLLFTAYPFIFQGVYRFTPGETGLSFIGIWVGSVFGLFGIMPWAQKKYLASKNEKTGKFSPEARLWPAIVGGPIFVLGMFWLGWTCYPQIHWIVPALAGIPLGIGVMTNFMATSSYAVDSYGIYAASALAAQTVSRSVLGFAFPLFSVDMYRNLGIHWATTILAFAAMLLAPVPFLFYKYGERIRMRSKYAMANA